MVSANDVVNRAVIFSRTVLHKRPKSAPGTLLIAFTRGLSPKRPTISPTALILSWNHVKAPVPLPHRVSKIEFLFAFKSAHALPPNEPEAPAPANKLAIDS